MDQPVIGVCARVCVRGSAISVPLWSPYGRMRGRVVEKNMRARRCIVWYPAEAFYPRGGGRKKEAMSGETVTSGVFYWQMKI